MRKLIDIPDDIMPLVAKLAMKERRKGKSDTKTFIQEVIIEYVLKNE